MKILIPLSDDRMRLGWSFARALKFPGHEVTIFNPFIRLSQSLIWASKVSCRLLERQILRRVGRANLTEMLVLGKFNAISLYRGNGLCLSFGARIKLNDRESGLYATIPTILLRPGAEGAIVRG